MITGSNFILKGGGWESDLYSGSSNRKSSSDSKSTESSTASSASASADD